MFDGCGGLALESVDGALLEDIAITNITMRDIQNCPIFMRLGARLRGPKETTRTGTLRRVLISNLTAHNSLSEQASIVNGTPGFAIEDLKFSNIFLDHQGGAGPEAAKITVPDNPTQYRDPNRFGQTPSHGFFFRRVRNLEIGHVEVRPEKPERPARFLARGRHAVRIFLPSRRPPIRPLPCTTWRISGLSWSRAATDIALAKADARTL